MKKRFRQEIAFSEARVTGNYKFAELFQIRPIHNDAATLDFPVGHHPFLLEYVYDVPDLKETNYNPELPEHVIWFTLDTEASDKARKWILLALSVFTRHRVFQYPRGPQQQKWFLGILKDSKDTSVSRLPQWGQGILSILVDEGHPIRKASYATASS